MIDFKRMRKLINRMPFAKFRIEQAKSAAYKVTATLSDEPKSTVQIDKVSDGVIMIEAAHEAYNELQQELKAMQDELRPLLGNVTDSFTRRCLELRYLECVSAKEIAYRSAYTERRICQLLQKGENEVLGRGG